MKKIIKFGFLLMAFVSITMSAQAQKYGYLNSDAILQELPEVKQMQPELESLGKILNKKREQMYNDFESKRQKAAQDQEAGRLAPADVERIQSELLAQQEEIMKYEQDMQDQLLKKQNSLLEPVIKKLNDAIDQVAKENGYTMIFNSGAGILLFADESQDVSSLVKQKLNI